MDMLPAMEQTSRELKSCSECGAQMPDAAAFCPGCGRSMQSESAAKPRSGSLRENFLGALAYLTFVPALIFLLRDPFRRNPYVRFHAVQCLLLWLVTIATAVLARLFVLLVLFIPAVGPLLAVLGVTILGLAALFTWIVLVLKAFQGERFGLPVLGDLAEQYSGES